MGKKWAGVILAGGRGSRMGTEVPKQFLTLAGKPMLWHALRAFSDSPVAQIVLVVPPGEEAHCRKEYAERWGFRKITAVAAGGRERYESAFVGLSALRGSDCEIVAIHDGARPLVTPELIVRTCEAAEAHGACVPAVPVKDTIKAADGENFAEATLPREKLWAVQTPQTFRYALCMNAYTAMLSGQGAQNGITDDAMVVERFSGTRTKLVMGDYRNLKVTTPEDLIAAEAYLSIAAGSFRA